MQKTNHERIKQWYEIEEKTWTDEQDLGNGIWCYKNVIVDAPNYVKKISKILESPSPFLKWNQARVGYNEIMPEYRDCYDFKYKAGMVKSTTSPQIKFLEKTYEMFYYRQLQPVKDYSKRYNIGELRYWEDMNLIRYGPGQHFQDHCDHGYSYNCTVSLVAYLNDDYVGGELYFKLQDLKIKPESGDLYIFPSNYMYPHRAMPVEKGIKYSLVTMLDYSDKFHNQQFYQETGS